MHYFPRIVMIYSFFIGVNFANEILVDEIEDLNNKFMDNFMHDVTDLYKFIGSRFRSGTYLLKSWCL